ncbi:sensor histidine kinase [Cohnella sp. GCM10027633]|uniref:sensor histidine kinase n=1 Tax=unclassified Cohnella TaxID=2636738 RepID=UPI0036288605
MTSLSWSRASAYFRYPRMRTRLLFSYLAVILLTVSMIGYLSYRISTKEIIGNTKAFSAMLTDQLSFSVPSRADSFEQSTYAIQNNEKLFALVSEKVEFATKERLYHNRRDVEAILSLFFGLSRDVRAVLVQSEEGHLYWYERNSYLSLSGSMDGKEARALYDWVANRLVAAGNPQSLWLGAKQEGEIAYTRKLIDPATLRSYGRIIFYMDGGYLDAVSGNHNQIYGGSTAILNRYGEVLYAEDNVRPIIRAWQGGAEQGAEAQALISVGGEGYYITRQSSTDASWEALHIVPRAELLLPSQRFRAYLLLTCLVSLVVTAVIALWISGTVTRSIQKLERTMRRVEEGDFSVQVKSAGNDEIGLLGQRFNVMLGRINELIQNLYVERLAKQQAEFQVLKAQIHPHFLFNTLGSIQWLAIRDKQPTIENMVRNLIGLLNTSVKRKSEFVMIREEFEYIDHYLDIQAFRYENRFRVVREVDRSLLDCMMLHFILQPLVENALQHGIEMSKGNGVLTLRAYRNDANLVLEVEDNGVGMSKDKLERIMKNGEGSLYPGLYSIGVRNVNERIQLYYGDEFGLRYRSEEGRGTVATVLLPLDIAKGGIQHATSDDRRG